MEKTTYRPKGYRDLTPYVHVDGASKFIDFVKEAFSAKELSRFEQENDKKIMHAVVQIGDSMLEVSDVMNDYPAVKVALHVYVTDVDSVYKKALKAGATSKLEPKEQFYGDKESFVEDPFGNFWYISTHLKDVSEEELKEHTLQN
jgi:PhnB protein